MVKAYRSERLLRKQKPVSRVKLQLVKDSEPVKFDEDEEYNGYLLAGETVLVCIAMGALLFGLSFIVP